tara:strand:- start:1722 stop:1943 length:222 start_codon:yes stop_codon:yes gene_type:complete
MKAILEFEFPRDQIKFDTASRGLDWALVVRDMDQIMHKKVKYSELSNEAKLAIEQLRLTMSDMLINRGLLYPE